eukprot:TRINITY_DN2062_c0_g2_i1.p1 TRINITY_DN2062_c0_g2~~TRINITY_DN2062_c0_g2_i1.p1  ORF type:complete len:224 (-),score=27.56 TRINITY_DN2062_c0_g2_i1:13-684(-)
MASLKCFPVSCQNFGSMNMSLPVASHRNPIFGQTFHVSFSPSRRHVPGNSQRQLLVVSANFPVSFQPAAASAVQWLVRMVAFYTMVKAGITGSKASAIEGNEKQEKDFSKLTSHWHSSVKGTLVRKYRVPSPAEGNRLLKEIASTLSDNDLFRDATSHKGCQIRRESAHGQSVCCNNIRAIFDEMPTPHLEIEITVFPAGPLTSAEYEKAAKLEGVLKKGRSI